MSIINNKFAEICENKMPRKYVDIQLLHGTKMVLISRYMIGLFYSYNGEVS